MFGDVDGVVVVPAAVVEDVLAESEAKVAKEELMRRDLAQGLSVTEVFERHGQM